MKPTLEVLGAKTIATVRGDGPPVLLLHGNPDTKEIWDGVIGLVSKTRRCVAPDLPGFGGSDVPVEFDFSLTAQARWVDALADAAKLDTPVTLVVHDIGGPYGLAWAVAHPGRVARIVVTNTVFSPEFQWHFWARVWRSPLVGELSMALMNYPLFARELRRSRRAAELELRESYARITPASKRAALAWYRAMSPDVFAGWSEKLHAIARQTPCVVCWGDRDPYIPKRFAESFGAEDVRHHDECGHWLLAERPGVLADAILAG